MKKIEVEYDGKYPNVCSGRLTIKLNGNVIYDKDFCCASTGCIIVDGDREESIKGELIWDDAKDFSSDIQGKVEQILSEVDVCCGGCI